MAYFKSILFVFLLFCFFSLSFPGSASSFDKIKELTYTTIESNDASLTSITARARDVVFPWARAVQSFVQNFFFPSLEGRIAAMNSNVTTREARPTPQTMYNWKSMHFVPGTPENVTCLQMGRELIGEWRCDPEDLGKPMFIGQCPTTLQEYLLAIKRRKYVCNQWFFEIMQENINFLHPKQNYQ